MKANDILQWIKSELENTYGPLWKELRRNADRKGIIGLTLIPAILVLVFLLPPSIQRDMVLHYDAPSVFTLFSTHFVHAGIDHLSQNIAGYVLMIAVLYPLSIWGSRRRDFFQLLAVFVLLFPFIASGLNVVAGVLESSRGFSAINAAILGTIPVAVYTYLRECFEIRVRTTDAVSLALIGLSVLAFRYGAGTYLLIGVIALGIGLFYLYRTLRDIGGGSLVSGVRVLGSVPGHSEFLVFTVVLYAGLLFGLFPADIRQANGVTDIFSHYIGFAFGFLSAYVHETGFFGELLKSLKNN